ncbi:helix-turn-helix domain-containing protein [Poritiphilus flavus]|uniref:Helix-turn-helix domain-containing protein n=1 Tax=Poritiphilus flavus TaxID=2697053 RepID=A0A6L9E9A8_9FLAO|nr:helix-turn-helix domain-containing protein [Poritiphilus flavus]NAS11320.1 helix-turn-helix domain-containing protein [Poritiphilus flavus]
MRIRLDISKNLKDQFIAGFKLELKGDVYPMNPSLGEGGHMKVLDFPGELEFYHFGSTRFKEPIEMTSVNPATTDWFIIHINLSMVKQEKKVGERLIHFQKYLPIGTLLYGPNLEIFTLIPQDVNSEVTTIRFSRRFLECYFENAGSVIDFDKPLSYEDLDADLESLLFKALQAMNDRLACHALILKFLQNYFRKLKQHEHTEKLEKIHPEDVQSLFKAAKMLRDPLASDIPNLKKLAAMANMGGTKFKTLFKQVFGKPPMEYRNRVRMEFAREEIQIKGRTPSELSHELGYAHPSNFTTAYKKFFGQLPSAKT